MDGARVASNTVACYLNKRSGASRKVKKASTRLLLLVNKSTRKIERYLSAIEKVIQTNWQAQGAPDVVTFTVWLRDSEKHLRRIARVIDRHAAGNQNIEDYLVFSDSSTDYSEIHSDLADDSFESSEDQQQHCEERPDGPPQNEKKLVPKDFSTNSGIPTTVDKSQEHRAGIVSGYNEISNKNLSILESVPDQKLPPSDENQWTNHGYDKKDIGLREDVNDQDEAGEGELEGNANDGVSTIMTLTGQIVVKIKPNSIRNISETRKTSSSQQSSSTRLTLIDTCSMISSKGEEYHNYIAIQSKESDADSIYHCTTIDSSSRFSFQCTNKGRILDLRTLPPDNSGNLPNLLILVSQHPPDGQKNQSNGTEELVLYNIDTYRKKIKSLLKLKLTSTKVAPLAVRTYHSKGSFQFAVLIQPDLIFFSVNKSTDRWFSDLQSSMSTYKIPETPGIPGKTSNIIALNIDSYLPHDAPEAAETGANVIVLRRTDSVYVFCVIKYPQKGQPSTSSREKLYHLKDKQIAETDNYTSIVFNSKLGFFGLLGILNRDGRTYMEILFIDYLAYQQQSDPVDITLKDRRRIYYELDLPTNGEVLDSFSFAESDMEMDGKYYYLIIYAVTNSSVLSYCFVARDKDDKDGRLKIRSKSYNISDLPGLPEKFNPCITCVSKTLLYSAAFNTKKEFKASISATFQDGYTFHINFFISAQN